MSRGLVRGMGEDVQEETVLEPFGVVAFGSSKSLCFAVSLDVNIPLSKVMTLMMNRSLDGP